MKCSLTVFFSVYGGAQFPSIFVVLPFDSLRGDMKAEVFVSILKTPPVTTNNVNNVQDSNLAVKKKNPQCCF